MNSAGGECGPYLPLCPEGWVFLHHVSGQCFWKMGVFYLGGSDV